MNRRIFQLGLLTTCLFANSLSALAHGPTRQKVTETIEINAPAEKVWNIIKNFGDAHVWLPMVESTSTEGDNEPGAKRVLSLGGDARVYETLKSYNAEAMKYSYRIPVKTHDVNILPVTNYSSTVSVKAKGSNCIVTWKGAFYRGYPNNDPPVELNDEAAVAAVSGLYQAGLTHLKKIAEQ